MNIPGRLIRWRLCGVPTSAAVQPRSVGPSGRSTAVDHSWICQSATGPDQTSPISSRHRSSHQLLYTGSPPCEAPTPGKEATDLSDRPRNRGKLRGCGIDGICIIHRRRHSERIDLTLLFSIINSLSFLLKLQENGGNFCITLVAIAEIMRKSRPQCIDRQGGSTAAAGSAQLSDGCL